MLKTVEIIQMGGFGHGKDVENTNPKHPKPKADDCLFDEVWRDVTCRSDYCQLRQSLKPLFLF